MTQSSKPSDAGVNAKLAALDAWLVAAAKLTRFFSFPDFGAPLAFANRVGQLAERENHHPDLFVSWDWVPVELTTTHTASCLTAKDLGLAGQMYNL